MGCDSPYPLSCGDLRSPSPLRGEPPPGRVGAARRPACHARRVLDSQSRDSLSSRFSERSVVCKTACEGLTPSRLSTANAVRTTCKDVFTILVATDSDHDGLVTLDSLIRSPHRVRFTGDPRAARDMRARAADARGARRLVTAPARQAGPGRCDPCAPHRFSGHSSTARSLPSEGRDEGSNPSAQTTRPRSALPM